MAPIVALISSRNVLPLASMPIIRIRIPANRNPKSWYRIMRLTCFGRLDNKYIVIHGTIIKAVLVFASNAMNAINPEKKGNDLESLELEMTRREVDQTK
jgi:hypothetical protein